MDVSEADLVGTWRLVRYDFVGPDGTARPRWPEGASGLLHYGADRRMSAHLAAEGRPATGDDMAAVAPETALAAMRGYTAYAGRWSLEGGRVRHDVEIALRPEWRGRTLWRAATLADGVLRLVAEGAWRDSAQGRAELDWVKI